MANRLFNSKKWLKICLIIYAAFFVIGIAVTCIRGLKLDINFIGGARLSYSFTGEVAEKDFNAAVGEVVENDFTVSLNTSLAGDSKTYTISLTGNEALSAETQEKITEKLEEKFKDNEFELYDSNSVSPSVAGAFFVKSLVAVLITAALVVLYVGIRFRKIGGVSAAITALITLVLDLITAFLTCGIFGLQIDSNFMAVVLTILGYSLNDTIVVYDRVRENRNLYPSMSLNDNMDKSISGIITRNIVTTVTTVIAVLTIIVVSEIYGLTSLRTFAIPMALGLVSGCFSSLFIAGPLWVIWNERKSLKK